MPEPLAQVELEAVGSALRILVRGEVDLSNAERVYSDIRRGISERDPTAVLIDLSDVEYLDSQGIFVLLKVAGELRERRVSLRLVAPPESVAGRLLAISQIGSLGVEPRDEQPR